MANTTTNYGWQKPTVGGDADQWGYELNTDLDGIDSTVHGIDVRTSGPSTTVPSMDGVGAVGTQTVYARGDHVHPSDTTKLGDAPTDGASYVRKSSAWSALPSSMQQVPIAFPFPGKLPGNNSVYVPMSIALNLPLNCAGSIAQCFYAPATSAQFILYSAPAPGNAQPSWTQIGTITFAAGAFQGTFSCPATSFTTGMILALNTPFTQDANLDTVGITLLFTRT
jgi:hypothetical protein